MKSLLKTARINKKLKTREIAQFLGIDQALISKFENGVRIPTKIQVKQLADFLDLPYQELMVLWLKEKILVEIGEENYAQEALQLVQEELESYNLSPPSSSEDLTNLLNEIDDLKSKLDKLRQFDSYRIAQALELDYTFESNRI